MRVAILDVVRDLSPRSHLVVRILMSTDEADRHFTVISQDWTEDLSLFENILSERNEGITMYKIKTKVASRVAVAAALSMGITAGAVGVASASPFGHHSDGHDGNGWTQSQTKVEGIVSAYTAGASISIQSKGSTTPTNYLLTSATTITGLATGATLASGAEVELVVSTTLPATVPPTVTAIKVETPKIMKIEGIVTAYTAGATISIQPKGSTTPTNYLLTSATTITGLATGATLASGAEVELVVSTTLPATVPPTVTAIKVETPKIMKIEGIVTAYTAGATISIQPKGSTTPTNYLLTSATTITGLATGATLASGAEVELVVSTTLPATVPPTVTAIKVETPKP